MNEADKSTKIFITGATGFVGSYIVRFLLQKGYKNITALRRKSSDEVMCYDFLDRIKWIEGDILDQELLIETISEMDWVFHSAAVISLEPKMADLMMQVNIEGTKNIVEACLMNNNVHLLHLSSIAAIGKPWDKTIYNEEDIWTMSNDVHNYSISKFRGEQEVWRGIAEGMKAAIVNPSVILGAGRWNEATGLLFSKIHGGFKYVPQGKTGFVDVRDVAKVSVELLENGIKSERFLLNAENTSYKEFFNKIALAFNKKAPTVVLSKSLGEILWRGAAVARFLGLKVPLTKEIIRSINSESVFSNEKICKTLDYSFISLDETVRDTSKAFIASTDERIKFLEWRERNAT